jgi:cullin-4
MGEDMFKDLTLSRDMVQDYHSKLPAEDSGRKLSVMVLQRSAWPFNVQKTTIDLPPNVRLFLVCVCDSSTVLNTVQWHCVR